MSARDDIADVERVFREMYRCMLDADIRCLETLLDPKFTLTHMTGFVQPRAEWLSAIRSGEMAYHDAREVSIATAVEGDRASIVGRHRVDATIFGSRGTWRLQLTGELLRRLDRWLIASVVATTFI
jgi:hypothetical protein